MSDPLFAIARSGMDIERLRMEVIAQNLANATSVRGENGELYQPIRLLSGPAHGFAQALDHASATAALAGVRSYGVEAVDRPARIVHEPAHPAADADGNVAYPGIDHAGEMALMVQTLRAYEANVVMYNAARAMFMRAMDLGGAP